ncbi:MAG: hypothetical protein KatS3mg101_0540 [Patescibacteria group bacterium]|nr:MAG: hypothetical protein KatS3mg101_0540 [Patescibacteria group bacterium]
MKNKGYKLIALAAFVAGLFLLSNDKALADCESNYGGGETCIYNKRFSIEKKVRIEGDDDWESKVTDVDEDDVVEFRIRIKNLSDEDIDKDFDDMKMSDSLPKEMERVGGSGLTEYWDDFDPGETKTFIIKAQIDEDEFDRDEAFDKCVVNKAKVYWDDEFEGSDTATVCYGKGKPKELPNTGAVSITGISGIGLLLAGALMRKRK